MKVMVAVDGSRQADDAVRMVDELGLFDTVVLLHVVDSSRVLYPVLGIDLAVKNLTELERQLRKSGAVFLERARAFLKPGSRVVTTRIVDGSPGDAIVQAARKESVDLLVVGARGLGPIKELVLGSVSHRVLSHAPCPVLVVHGWHGPLRRVLVAAEGPEDAKGILAFLAKKPFPPETIVEVLTVVPRLVSIPELQHPAFESILASEAERGRTFAGETAGGVHSLGYRAEWLALMGSPAEAILEHAETSGADLILMASRGRGAISRLFLGSAAHAVLHRARCPVMIVRGAPVPRTHPDTTEPATAATAASGGRGEEEGTR